MATHEYINKIIQGDCLEVMKGIPDNSIDLVLTDPPYGIGMSGGLGGNRGFSGKGKPIPSRQYNDYGWDKKRPSRLHFNEMIRISKKVMIFGGNFFADILPQGSHWLVWDKLNTMPTFSDCELIYTNIKRKSVMKYTYEYNGLIGKEKQRFHPTQKPVKLIGMLLKDYTQKSDIILDPFLGSGTTAVACKMLDRNYIGIELSEEYCEIARDRIENTLPLFDGLEGE